MISTDLSVISWNIEAKKTLDDLEDIQRHRWGVLLLQETSKQFTAGGHVVNLRAGDHNASGIAVVVHHRWAKAIQGWGGDRFPWVTLKTNQHKLGFSTVAFMSCYMP